MTEATNLYERLAKARAAFQQRADFKKVKTDGLKYAYLPIEQAKPLIEEVTAEQCITIIPGSVDIFDDPAYTYSYEKESPYYKGQMTKWRYMTATVSFAIVCPEESKIIPVMAEAQDNSDKCISKLYTAAYKNLVKIMFGFAESPKDDADATQEEIPSSMMFKKSKVDPKIAEAEAKKASEKDGLISRIRWKCLINEDIASSVRYKLSEEVKYEGDADPDKMAKFLKTAMNIENLTALSEYVDSLDGKVTAVE